MNILQAFFNNLSAFRNPFLMNDEYIVPKRGDRMQDLAHIAQDFKPVYDGLTQRVDYELSRNVI